MGAERSPRLVPAARLAALMLLATAGSAAAQCDVVFRDGFESGDRSGWQVWRPPPCTTWQWQLTGTIDIAVDVAMFDV
ncbi:MAG TPA: endo alpha-1,4 polygalactosaminidase, partial [Thermoanaerobaculia bacterium]|nr:endo alpha-1,4 polygalactosaminidase [Thermoanaerobaculia bacterium]